MNIPAVVAVLLIAAPAFAQRVVSDHPPLSPAEAVRVLQSSRSPRDIANRPILDRAGPQIVIFGTPGAIAPWDWPAETYTPIRPLSNSPYGYLPAPFYGYGYDYALPIVTVNPWTMHAPRGFRDHRHVTSLPPERAPMISPPAPSTPALPTSGGVIIRR